MLIHGVNFHNASYFVTISISSGSCTGLIWKAKFFQTKFRKPMTNSGFINYILIKNSQSAKLLLYLFRDDIHIKK